jgi:hypothetical protein
MTDAIVSKLIEAFIEQDANTGDATKIEDRAALAVEVVLTPAQPSGDVRERVARALCEVDDRDPDAVSVAGCPEWEHWTAFADAALTATPAVSGWRPEYETLRRAIGIMMAAPWSQKGDELVYEIDGEQIGFLVDELIRPGLRAYGHYDTPQNEGGDGDGD